MSTIGVRSGKNPTKEFFPIQCQTPGQHAVDANGSDIDRYRNGGYAALTLMILPGTWTDGTHAFIIEEADDNGSGAPSTYGTVAAADVIGGVSGAFVTITSAGTAVIQRIDYIGRKRWVRVRYDYTAGSTGAAFAVVALLFSPTIYPAA